MYGCFLLCFSLKTSSALAAGDVDLALALGHTEIGLAGGADEEFIFLTLLEFFFADTHAAVDRALPFQIVQVFQITLFNVAAENTENGPEGQHKGCDAEHISEKRIVHQNCRQECAKHYTQQQETV